MPASDEEPASSPVRPAAPRPGATRAPLTALRGGVNSPEASGAISIARPRTEPPSTLKCGRYPESVGGLNGYPSENKVYLHGADFDGHRLRGLRGGLGGTLRAANYLLLLANPVTDKTRVHLSHTFTPSRAAPRSARDRRGTRRRAASTPRRGPSARRVSTSPPSARPNKRRTRRPRPSAASCGPSCA